MKKITAVILAVIILAVFAGCGKNETTVTFETPAPAEEKTEAVPEVPETEEEPQEEEAPAELEEAEEDSDFDEEKYNIAAAYPEGEGMDELIEKIGQPNSEDYAPGCSGHEEEGILYYDGFQIYTYRDGGYVTFYMVEKN